MTMIPIHNDAELSVQLKGDGEPIMLVSGLGGCASFWSNQVDEFSNSFKVITHDHRGTGDSTLSPGPYSVAQIAEDILSLMDALELPEVSLVGHSTGGAVAQYLAIYHADRLKKIVLSATWAGPSMYFTKLFELRRKILVELGVEAFSQDGIIRAFPTRRLFEQPEILSDMNADRMARFPGIEIMSSRIGAVLSHDQRINISKISIPTLIVCAEDDLITPALFSDELADKIPGAENVRFPYGGHFLPQVCVDEYNSEVLKFLRQ